MDYSSSLIMLPFVYSFLPPLVLGLVGSVSLAVVTSGEIFGMAPLAPIRFVMFWFCFWLVRAVLNRFRNSIKYLDPIFWFCFWLVRAVLAFFRNSTKYLFPKKILEEEQPIPRSTEAIPSIDPPGTSPMNMSEDERPIPRNTEWFQSPVPQVPSDSTTRPLPFPKDGDVSSIKEQEWFQPPVPRVPSDSTTRPRPYPKDVDALLTKEQVRALLKRGRLNARSTEVARSEAAQSTQAPVRSSVRPLPFPKNGDIPLTKEQKRANLKQARLNARSMGP